MSTPAPPVPDPTSRSIRERMVAVQVAGRGILSDAVLRAMAEVPREEFVADDAVAFAYEDTALSIGEGQTISQPYIVARMAEAAEIGPEDRVLEVGTGSGYGAAVLSRIAARVFTIERYRSLAEAAESRYEILGYDNVEVRLGDGTLGWPDAAPFDAIVVTAGGRRDPPRALLEQLAPGGRLIIPLGSTPYGQSLTRIRKSDDGADLEREILDPVRFVPLVGAEGWPGHAREEGTSAVRSGRPRVRPAAEDISAMIAEAAEPLNDREAPDLDALMARIGHARLVLLGDASHGTSDFYRLRARITQELIEKKGFDFVAIEADWPDAGEIDAYVRHHPEDRPRRKPFQKFPRWMWANTDVMDFVHWLRDFNGNVQDDEPGRMAAFHGLDLYSMHTSIAAVLSYLGEVDPATAEIARARYACLMPWQNDPILYGRAVQSGRFDECENDVVAMLQELLDRRMEYLASHDGTRFMDAVQNARLVVNSERYYRTVYRGSVASWNLRDQHMVDTLEMLMAFYGPESRGVVWAHNSHLGDASATAMGGRGEHNVGQLVRQEMGEQAYLVGMGTHTGTVAAASDWGGPMEIKRVRPSHAGSYESLCHTSGLEGFLLPLGDSRDAELTRALAPRRLERAIGVIYRPETELQSHYFQASLASQFDEWIWLDETEAVTPLTPAIRAEAVTGGVPDTYPFGL